MELEKKTWTYISHGIERKVYCDRNWFLFLKLCYCDTGLTVDEYNEYTNYLNNTPMTFKFVGINSRCNKCYNSGETFIEEVNGDFYLLNQSPEYGMDGIEGEPLYKINKSFINIIS